MTERDVYPAVAGRVTAFGRPRVALQSFDLLRSHVRVRSCTFTSVPVLGAPLRSTCASDSKSPTRLFNLVERTSLIKIIFRFIRWRSVDDREVQVDYYPPRPALLTLSLPGTVRDPPSRRVSRLGIHGIIQPALPAARYAVAPSGVAYAVHTVPSAVRPAARRYKATCYMYEVPVSPIRWRRFDVPMWRAVPRSYKTRLV